MTNVSYCKAENVDITEILAADSLGFSTLQRVYIEN